MKKFLVALSALLSLSAFAAQEIKIMDLPATMHSQGKASFEINRELGRAWVMAEMKENWGGPRRRDQPSKYFRTQVPGLSFDQATSTIVYEHEGRLIECAKATQRGRLIFRYESIQHTGCHLKAKRVRAPYDDGYRTYKRERMQVYLVIRD